MTMNLLRTNDSCFEVSVIIPTFMPGVYLYECLLSVFNQTLDKKSYEIIVILNGLHDPYYSGISEYITKNKNNCQCLLLYTSEPNVSNARNVGLQIAKGKNICFIDDDDIISVDYLKLLAKEINDGIIVISNVYSFVHDISELGNDFFVRKYLNNFSNTSSVVRNRGFLAFPVAKMIPKSVIAGRLFDKRFKRGEDALFMTIISDRIKSFSLVKRGAVYYIRKREGSVTSRKEHTYILLKECVLLILAYFGNYLRHPFRYSFRLFLYRIPGVIRNTYFLSKK